MDKEERVTGMYTNFITTEQTPNTVKFIPDPRWDGDPEIAKLFLEDRYNIKKKLDEPEFTPLNSRNRVIRTR
jgi:hypothetical protein